MLILFLFLDTMDYSLTIFRYICVCERFFLFLLAVPNKYYGYGLWRWGVRMAVAVPCECVQRGHSVFFRCVRMPSCVLPERHGCACVLCVYPIVASVGELLWCVRVQMCTTSVGVLLQCLTVQIAVVDYGVFLWCATIQMSITSVGVVCKCTDAYRKSWCGM